MLPKDKYTIFDKKERTYRKGIHSMLFLFYWLGWEIISDSVFLSLELPKWTRVSQRINPPGF